MPSEAGDVIDGRFRVESRIGAGAAGDVYVVSLVRAWRDLARGTKLALKWYSERIFGESEATIVARRLREAALGNRVNHPNLVRTFDLAEEWEGRPPRYLVMTYVEGADLDHVEELLGAPLPIDTVYSIMRQLAGGVAALHAAGVVHRDIKPANIVVQQDGRVVLLDLGVARPHGEETITESGAFLGTLCYAAPEWLFGETCSPASDVYSLGGVLYRLLIGKGLFADVRPFAAQVLAVQARMPEISEVDRDPLRAYAGTLASQMLLKEAARRPPIESIAEFFSNHEASAIWAAIRSKRRDEIVRGSSSRLGWQIPASQLESVPVDVLDRHLAASDPSGLAGEVIRRATPEQRVAMLQEAIWSSHFLAVPLDPDDPSVLPYLIAKHDRRGLERLRAIEKEAAARGLSPAEQKAFVWSRTLYPRDLERRIGRLAETVIKKKDELETDWPSIAELKSAVRFVRNAKREDVQESLRELNDVVVSEGQRAEASRGADELAPDDVDELIGHQQKCDDAYREVLAIKAAIPLLDADPEISDDLAWRTLRAQMKPQIGELEEEIAAMLRELVVVRTLLPRRQEWFDKQFSELAEWLGVPLT